jgi:uncharacterized protein YutE (UPF0331/DUF86 family)
MYYVNKEQIEERLDFLPYLIGALRELPHRWQAGDALMAMAGERALHLAIEAVTDVGSLLIDGFLMRDASSYEDIVEILQGEGVFPAETGALLLRLVQQRRPLVQDYGTLDRTELHPLIREIPGALERFPADVRSFIAKELQ